MWALDALTIFELFTIKVSDSTCSTYDTFTSRIESVSWETSDTYIVIIIEIAATGRDLHALAKHVEIVSIRAFNTSSVLELIAAKITHNLNTSDTLLISIQWIARIAI